MSFTLAAVTLAAALGAAPAPSGDGKQIKLAAPGLTGVNLNKERVEFFSNHFAQEMNNRGVRVITAQEVNAVLGLARTQQLMGCDESSTNCMAELADALGVDGVITGSIGQFGNTYQANLVIASNGNGKLLSNVTVKGDSEAQMLDQLTIGARNAASEVGVALGKPSRHFSQQSVFVDVLDVVGGGVNLRYARALNSRWSLYAAFSLGLNQQIQQLPGVGITGSQLVGEARYHFFDTPPFGLYLGGGLGFLTAYGFGSGSIGAISIGTAGFAAIVEAGYAIALFDWLHLSAGLLGYLGAAHFGGVDTFGNVANEIQPIFDGHFTLGAGIAF